MLSQGVCDFCHMPCTSYRFHHNKRVCFTCKLPDGPPSLPPLLPVKVQTMKKAIKTRDGEDAFIAHGDRFLWSTFKWYVVDFLDADNDVVVRLEGTGDVATLPEMLVGELVEEFNLSIMMWR